jgi:hypothetical protein
VEPLEARIALSTVVTLSGGNLTIVGDHDSAGQSESLFISQALGFLQISDPSHAVTAGHGVTAAGVNLVRVPIAALHGSLTIKTGSGADSVEIVNGLPALTALHITSSDPASTLTLAGTVHAVGPTGLGGNIVLQSGLIGNGGRLSASGTTAGSIAISAEGFVNQGIISADSTLGNGGAILLSLAQQGTQGAGGVVSANGGSHGHGGNILLQIRDVADPNAAFEISGLLRATGLGAGETGGTIAVTGPQIEFDAAGVNVSGAAGGGRVFVGGGLHGAGTLAHAQYVLVDDASLLRADATVSGHGGTVVVWSDRATAFAGLSTARGGVLGGAGGTLEVSSRGSLAFYGRGDASAPHGAKGTLLLDPKNLIVAAPAGATLGGATDGSTETVDPAAIIATLDTGTAVTLQASNDLTIDSAILAHASGHGGALTLTAGRSLLLHAGISTDGGAITLIANAILAKGVVDSDRDPGAAAITIDSGVNLDAGGGAVRISVQG